MHELRPYQVIMINETYRYLSGNPGKNPCIVLPTGGGKTVIIAKLCHDIIESGARALVLTHQKELIEQDAEELREELPDADIGIYSASVGRKEKGRQITFAGIQSIWRAREDFSSYSIVIVDECHLINHRKQGMYRSFIDYLRECNRNFLVIGLTATPYRLGHGKITEGKDALFDALIEPEGADITTLIREGWLARPVTKATRTRISTEGIGIDPASKDYKVSDISESMMRQRGTVEAAIAEARELAADRKSWLIFCASVEHAEQVCEICREQGLTATCVHGGLPRAEREERIRKFKDGEVRVMTNCMVLTTGFNHRGIDCIISLRPTLSLSLHLQSAGRGLRTAPGKKDCLYLDFVGNFRNHGPVNRPVVFSQSRGVTTWRTRECPECHEIVASDEHVCPSCGHEWRKREVLLAPMEKTCPNCGKGIPVRMLTCPRCGETLRKFSLSDAEVFVDDDGKADGSGALSMEVAGWRWSSYYNANNNYVLKCLWFGKGGRSIATFYSLQGNNWAVAKSCRELCGILRCDLPVNDPAILNALTPPDRISYTTVRGYHRITRTYYKGDSII